jgi:hypothetical protein
VVVSDAARQHFKTGVAYLEDPDGARYEEAYREFKAAYADSPSWKILGNLGLSALKLERDGEVVEAFEKYLSEGGAQIDAAERSQMERDLMTTKAGLVWVEVTVTPPGAILVDERQPLTGRPVTNRYEVGANGSLRIGVRRGRHKVTARLQGYDPTVWEFDAEPGTDITHTLELKKPVPVAARATGGSETAAGPVMERPITMPVIIGAAATGALLIGGGVVGVMAMGKNSDFKDANDGNDPSGAEDIQKSGKTLNLVADILLGTGVVAGVVTTVLFLNRPEVPASGPPADTARLRLVPAIGPQAGALFMTGKF